MKLSKTKGPTGINVQCPYCDGWVPLKRSSNGGLNLYCSPCGIREFMADERLLPAMAKAKRLAEA